MIRSGARSRWFTLVPMRDVPFTRSLPGRLWRRRQSMRADWDRRARENAPFYVCTTAADSPESFAASGERDLETHVLDGLAVSSGWRVLEIGCGVGRLVKPLAARVARVVGVDLSEEMIRRAREYCARAFLDDRPLNQIRILHHQLDEFIVRQIAFGDPKRLVDRLLRAHQLARRHLHLAQQVEQLLLRNRIDVVVDGIEVHAALFESGVDLPTCGAGRLLIDDDFHFASGSGRSWKCAASGFVPLPPSISHGVRSPLAAHKPRPFQPVFGSSMRPSNPLA